MVFITVALVTAHTQAANQVKALYNLFTKVDATQVEINPFGETPDGKGTQSSSSRIFSLISIVLLFSLL